MSIAPTQAEQDAVAASSRDPEIARAGEAMMTGDMHTAEAALRSVLRQRPDDFVALRMLGEIAASVGLVRDGEMLFRQALDIAPGFAFARLHLALALHDQDRPAEALAEFRKISGHLLDHEQTRSIHADMLERVGEYADAIRLYQGVLESNPSNLEARLRLAFLLKTVGRIDEAVEACRAALDVRPAFGEAWWLLADLKSYKFTDADVAQLEAALASPALRDDDRFRLHFALGKALEDRKQAAASFDHYRAGNRLRAAQLRYDPERTARYVDRCEQLFTPGFLADRASAGDPAPDPIFILGMPRSGSTLVEQMLASHPLIEGTSELPDIHAIVGGLEPDPRAGGTPYPELLADLPLDRLTALGALYLQRTRIQRKTDRPHFLDKMPNNWMHVGLIHLILPNAKIVDTRRHPLACGFSNFKQLYGRGQEFSYDLGHFGRHYADYVRLMAHFDRVLPGRIHRVIHEQLVEEPEAEIRRLLDHLGLPFDEACLNFHETQRPVRTASAEQVRQPIRKQAAEEWRAFGSELGPLKQALGATLDRWDGAPPS